MAVRPLNCIAEVLLEGLAALATGWRRSGSDRADLVSLIRTHVRPLPGVELVVPGGALLTGVVVVADNRPVLMLCARHEPPPRHWPRIERDPVDFALFDDELNP